MCTTRNNKNKNIKNLIFTNLRWDFESKKVKGKHTNRITGEVKIQTICMLIQKLKKAPTPTTNNYKEFEEDKLVNYCNYQQSWKLDSGASGHYYGPNTGVKNRRKKQNGIKVQVADRKNMDQVQKEKAPFDGSLEDAADVQISPNIPNPLMSCGKIVKKRPKNCI